MILSTRLLGPLAVSVAFVTLLGGPACPAAEPDDKLVVSFSYWANYTDNEFWREICARFEDEHPDVAIRRLWYVGEYSYKLQLDVVSGDAADIIMMDDEIFPAYATRGYLEDLTPYTQRTGDATEKAIAAEFAYLAAPESERDPSFHREYLPTSLESFNFRGFQGALPWNGNSVLVFYNKDLFDAEGIPYPADDWTWDDFRSIANKLTKDLDGDGITDQFGTHMHFILIDIEPLVWSFGGDILNEDRTRSAIHEPRGAEAGQFLYDMKYVDRCAVPAGLIEGINTEVLILTGRIGMTLAGSYMISMLNQVDDAMAWDVAPIPKGPCGDRFTRVTWDGISINAHTTPEKKEVAWEFIKFVQGEWCQRRIGSTQRGFPVRTGMESCYVDPGTPAREEVAIEATAYGRLTPITTRYMELRNDTAVVFNKLNMAGDDEGVTPQDSFAKLEGIINEVLSKEQADWSARVEGERKRTPHSGLKALGVAFTVVAGLFGIAMLIPPARRGFMAQVAEARRMFRTRRGRRQAFDGILFASPWLVGLCLFTAFPIIFSVVLSFCEWDPYEPISELNFIGLDNFKRALSPDPATGDPLVPKALYNTFYYAFFAVPLGLAVSLGLAILLNQKVRGITVFRTTFYLPSIVAGVATAVLWTYILNPIFGPLNGAIRSLNHFFDWTVVLAFIDLPEPGWLNSAAWAKPSLILMSLWGAGGAAMLIFLAGLQGVPDQLYEVAELDGAGRFRKFWNITLPMLTPTIYFNLIMGIIAALKVFMQAYIMTKGKGGVDDSLLFFVLHLYNKAFVEFEMGYASALAWILFAIILGFTLLIIRSSAVWVYYEGEKKR